MAANKCSFCQKFSSRVQMARICPSCAKGRTGDQWCDFCNQSTNTEAAFICPDCAVGQVGDDWCDFCKKTTRTDLAKICGRCG